MYILYLICKLSCCSFSWSCVDIWLRTQYILRLKIYLLCSICQCTLRVKLTCINVDSENWTFCVAYVEISAIVFSLSYYLIWWRFGVLDTVWWINHATWDHHFIVLVNKYLQLWVKRLLLLFSLVRLIFWFLIFILLTFGFCYIFLFWQTFAVYFVMLVCFLHSLQNDCLYWVLCLFWFLCILNVI